MDAITTISHQIINWLGYIAMFAFVGITLLAIFYYIGRHIVRLIRRLFLRQPNRVP